MNLIDKLKETFFLIKKKIIAWFNELCDEIKNIENKKRFGLIVGSWVLVFILIVCISKIKEIHDKNTYVRVLAETESPEEVSEADIKIESVIIKKETMAEKTTDETIVPESTEVQNSEVDVEIIEKETIPFEKIEVATEQLYDDAVITAPKSQVIYSEPGEKKSSKTYDEDRFINCIDVSKHQGDIDWKSVKESGIDYAIIRVAYRGYETGKIAKDSKFEKNIKDALANDIKVGVYFFSQATNKVEALEEASVILKYIKGYNITLPVVIDWETAPGYRTYSGISKSELTDIISVFCDTVKKYGYDPMVYMCQTDFTGRVNGKKLAQKYKIWVAWYFGCYAKNDKSLNRFKYGEDIPDLTYNYNVWQYSKNGYVKGISTPVDMNVYILPKKIPNPVLTVDCKDKVVDYNDKKYDILSGVKLVNHEGKNITNKVKYLLKNINSKPVTKEEAMLNPGKYLVSYYYEDNPKVYKEINLYVRDIPAVYFDEVKWCDNVIKNVDYIYDTKLSIEENLESIKTQILSKIEVRKYNLPFNNDYSIIDGEIINFNDLIIDGCVCEGEYELRYKSECLEGIVIERIIKLNILCNSNEENETDANHKNEEKEEITSEENSEETGEEKEETTEKISEENVELEEEI